MSTDTPKTVHVAPPMTSDKPAWMDLWAQYNAFYGREGGTALSPEIVEATWTRILDPASSVNGLVAAIDGELVGLAHVVFHDSLIQLHQTCYMQDLYTTPNARGRGVAYALIEEIALMCRSRDVRDVYWHTQADNKVARRLYDQVGKNTHFVVYRKSVR